MDESLQSHWQDYYVIIGTAAAALTGLMFVVITLISGFRQRRPNEGINTFSTPTLIHFCTVLIIAALLSVPWPRLWNASFLFIPLSLAGIIYMAVIAVRMLHIESYQPVLEDWVLYLVVPFLGYASLFVAAILLMSSPIVALFIFGGVALLFLIIAIYSAWELVTYLVIQNADETQNADEKQP